MAATTLAWPRKQGEIADPMVDSSRWNGFEFRDDDIVITTYPKSGTTLTLQIVSQLVFNADASVFGSGVAPWIEARPQVDALDRARAQTHRRFLKTHLPLPNLVFSPKAKYLFVGRDARDVAWSFHNHLTEARPEVGEFVMKTARESGAPPPPPVDPDVRRYYHDFLDGGGQPPYWPHIQAWWDVRGLPNVQLLHYADLIGDMAGQIRRIAAFLDIPLDEARLPVMVAHCSIAHMRNVAADDPLLNTIFNRGAESFINKGTNGRWRDLLSQAEIDRCDEIAARELTPDCAAWLRTGAAAAAGDQPCQPPADLQTIRVTRTHTGWQGAKPMDLIPETRRGAVGDALLAAFGARPAVGWRPLLGGASGALILQFEVGARAYVLKAEPEQSDSAHLRRGFRCMTAAADVEAAPAVHYANPETGVTVTDFVTTRPLADYPGGTHGLARGLAELMARVRTAPRYPRGDYLAGCDMLLRMMQQSGLFAPRLLEPHAEGLARIREALPWDPERLVPSHNDPNPGNILFDGERLWLVDWGLGFRNDPLVDVAILAHRSAAPELEDALLTAIFERAPDQPMRARLAVIRLLTWLFYAGVVLPNVTVGPAGPEIMLDPCDWDAFYAAGVGRDRTSREAALAFGKIALAAFLDGVSAPGFAETLAAVRG
jgi:aryl sulfotransferase